VSRVANYIIYSVEAEYIDAVVAQYGPCTHMCFHARYPRLIVDANSRYVATKVGAIVGGQTSVKAPERAAFEKYLPQDVDIVSCHSLHGPTVSPEGEPLVSAYTRAASSGS
jgi:prephenate dehydrogenase (NADP+)